MVTRSYVYAVPGERQALLRGPAGFWASRAGFRGMWSAVERGWWLRAEVVPDMLARAEFEDVVLEYREHRAPRAKARRS